MKRGVALLSILALTVTGIGAADAPDVLAQTPPSGVIPGPPPGEAHAPIHVRGKAQPSLVRGLTPSQVAKAYGFDQVGSCVTAQNHFNSNNPAAKNDCGNGQTIAIVDAFNDTTAESDLGTFSSQFGLPPCTTANGCFTKINMQNRKTRSDQGWALEVALDIEWAHAMAPGAKIMLVQATSNSFADLFAAVDRAVSSGAKVVSMSWSGGEFSTESNYDSHFNKSGVCFTAASGDSGSGGQYPSVSPYVISVGGTDLTLDSNNNWNSETAWSGSGGGLSSYEAEPGYQTSYSISSNSKRATPDVAYVAGSNSAVAVYDSTPYNGQTGWFEVYGTSVGAPQWASLIAIANTGRSSSAPLSCNSLTSSPFYSAASSNYTSNYHDITTGSNGNSAGNGYDLVTGLGSPQASSLVGYLKTYTP